MSIYVGEDQAKLVTNIYVSKDLVSHKVKGVYAASDNLAKKIFPKTVANSKVLLGVLGSALLQKADNSFWVSGYNYSGQLGTGDTADRFNFIPHPSIPKLLDMTGGNTNTAVIDLDHIVHVCGSNQQGQLGLGTTNTYTNSNFVTPLNQPTTPQEVACGTGLFVRAGDNTIWSCGWNNIGSLAQPQSVTQVTRLTRCKGQPTGTALFTGNGRAPYLLSDNKLYRTGRDYNLGQNTAYFGFTLDPDAPQDVKLFALSRYYFCLLVTNDGKLWVRGWNTNGQLGLGDFVDRKDAFYEVDISALSFPIKQVACGEYHSFILLEDGSLYACGNNEGVAPPLGLPEIKSYETFTKVEQISDVAYVATNGSTYSLAIKTDGTLWGCGNNTRGALGLGPDITTTNNVWMKVDV